MANYERKIFRYLFMILVIWFATSFTIKDRAEVVDIASLSLIIMTAFIFLDLYYPIILLE